MAQNKQRPAANGAKLEQETLTPNLAPTTAGVNGLQLVVTTPAELQAIVDIAVAKAFASSPAYSPDIFDAGGLCEKLKISAPTLRKMIEDGLPFLRCGELRRFDLDAVKSWMANKGAP